MSETETNDIIEPPYVKMANASDKRTQNFAMAFSDDHYALFSLPELSTKDEEGNHVARVRPLVFCPHEPTRTAKLGDLWFNTDAAVEFDKSRLREFQDGGYAIIDPSDEDVTYLPEEEA